MLQLGCATKLQAAGATGKALQNTMRLEVASPKVLLATGCCRSLPHTAQLVCKHRHHQKGGI